jgi:hypothetical protein
LGGGDTLTGAPPSSERSTIGAEPLGVSEPKSPLT